MAITLQNLVDTVCVLAGPDGRKRSADAELLVPRVLVWVAQRAAANPLKRALVTDTFTVALVNGVGPMPASVLVEYMDQAAVSDPADPTMARKMRWIPDWDEFIRPLDLSLGYYTITDNGTDFVMTRPGAAYIPGAGMTGNVELTGPAVPAVVGGTLTTPLEIEQEVIAVLVAALKGGWEAIIAAETAK